MNLFRPTSRRLNRFFPLGLLMALSGLFGSLALCSLSAKPSLARIFLINGDSLHGVPLSLDTNGDLLFQADNLSNTPAFPLKNILQLKLPDSPQSNNKNSLALIRLLPRFRQKSSDTILGKLEKLSSDSITLNTWYGGSITIKRSMIKSLKILNNAPGHFFGPSSLSEWKYDKKSNSWKFSNNALISLKRGHIGKNVKLRDRSHISFNLSWKNDMVLQLHLFSCDVSSYSPDAYYELNFRRDSFYLTTHGKINKAFLGGGGARWQQIQIPIVKKQTHFDIYADKVKGTFSIYLDGKRATLLQSPTPNPKNLGRGITFISTSHNPIEISDIKISSWNGTSIPLPNNLTSDTPCTSDKTKYPHTIILNNGDIIPGAVKKVLDDNILIDTKFTPIKIPLSRIQSLALNEHDEPKQYAGDVKAWFHHGGFITLKLISLKKGKLSGFSQAVGNVSLDLKAFNKIDFQLYNDKANQLRKKLP